MRTEGLILQKPACAGCRRAQPNRHIRWLRTVPRALQPAQAGFVADRREAVQARFSTASRFSRHARSLRQQQVQVAELVPEIALA